MSVANDSLGNTTKFSSRVDFAEKYGNSALRFYLLEIARALLPQERIKVCWKYPLPARKSVELIYSEERKCARSKGTMKCGSNWICPACMQYIAARRRDELETAISRSQDKYFTLMATYTARHDKGMRLATLLNQMQTAYGDTFRGRWWSGTRESFGLVGAVRALEITYGQSGWHPHYHVILFVSRAMLSGVYDGAISDDQEIYATPTEYAQTLGSEIESRWLENLRKQGLSGNEGIAFDIRASDERIADYVSKYGRMPQDWTVNASAYEVASAHTKNAGGGNFGALDMLFDAPRNSVMKNLFLEYASATKGKSSLQWSPELKKLLDVEIIRDEIAAEGVETETDRLLAEIDMPLWKYIVDSGRLGQLMTYANEGNEGKVQWLIDYIRTELEGKTVYLTQWSPGM